MTIEAMLAKSILEHEEGLNHLLIQIGPLLEAEYAAIRLQLPEGVYLGEASGDCLRDDLGGYILQAPGRTNELLVEIYTREAIQLGLVNLGITVAYEDKHGREISDVLTVLLNIVEAESAEAEEIRIDEEVVRKVKQAVWSQRSATHPSGNTDILDCTPAKQLTYDPHYRSELEKQYRIEGGSC